MRVFMIILLCRACVYDYLMCALRVFDYVTCVYDYLMRALRVFMIILCVPCVYL
jgi:hypothetical protein